MEDNDVEVWSERSRYALIDEWVFNAVKDDGAIRLYGLLAMSVLRAEGYKLGRAYMAERCGCSVDTIDRRLRVLQDAGVLRVETTSFKGGSGWNRYVLLANPRGGRKSAARGAASVRGGGPQECGTQEDSREKRKRDLPPYPPPGGTTSKPKGMRVCDACQKYGTLGVDMRRYERRRLARGDTKFGYLHETCSPEDSTTTTAEGWATR